MTGSSWDELSIGGADPKDGDVVVRTVVNGVNIKGTYKESTNTWEVGELPEERWC